MANTRAQVVATLGPASNSREVFLEMLKSGLDVVRLNGAWLSPQGQDTHIMFIRQCAHAAGVSVKIIQDLPGPRVQLAAGHTYDKGVSQLVTPEDERAIAVGALHEVEYIALSFVGSAEDVRAAREVIKKHDGTQKIIAKIERKVALDAIDAILAEADALMVARGDLGSEIPLEEVPFAEELLIKKANAAGKPVIVATQMMLSMVEHNEPTRAEVEDVAAALQLGADAVMLSEESAIGKYPLQAVAMMERIITAEQGHETPARTRNLL